MSKTLTELEKAFVPILLIYFLFLSVMDALVYLDLVGTVLYTEFYWIHVPRVPSMLEMWVGANTSTQDPVRTPDIH